MVNTPSCDTAGPLPAGMSNGDAVAWAVDGDINKPLSYAFLAEAAMVGICKVYAITQKAIRALELVDRPPHGIEECS